MSNSGVTHTHYHEVVEIVTVRLSIGGSAYPMLLPDWPSHR